MIDSLKSNPSMAALPQCSGGLGRLQTLRSGFESHSCYNWRDLTPIHTRNFAPGACSRVTLREQSSSVCINDFMGILHLWEQNFHPPNFSTIFIDRLNIWEQALGANWANLNLPYLYKPQKLQGSFNSLLRQKQNDRLCRTPIFVTVNLVLIISSSSYMAHSIKVALGDGNCALQSYCLVVAQANHCGRVSM